MPINNNELISLMEKSSEYNEIISNVRKLFETDETSFDMSWRDKFINEII